MSASSQNPVDNSVCALILAAGKGTRMKSQTPKVLHTIAGKPMLGWVMEAVKQAGAEDVTLVLSPETTRFGHFLDSHPNLRVAIQEGQRGTGDAVASAAPAFKGQKLASYARGKLLRGTPTASGWVLITAGDTPAISGKTIKEFVDSVLSSGKKIGVLGMNVPEPKGYGRLICDKDGFLQSIVEERDATTEQRKINLCNSGIIMAKTTWLFQLLESVTPSNSQNEYYLTDVFKMSAERGEAAYVFESSVGQEFAGVNDRIQLQAAEHWMQTSKRNELMLSGVTMHLPETIYIEAGVEIQEDVNVGSSCSFLGSTKIGPGVIIGPNVVLKNVIVGQGADIGFGCMLSQCKINDGQVVPPGTVRSGLDI